MKAPGPFFLLNLTCAHLDTRCFFSASGALGPSPPRVCLCPSVRNRGEVQILERKASLGAPAVAPGFKNKNRYTLYVSLGSQFSHITINKGNINKQCLTYNVLSIKNITLDSKQRKDNSDPRVKLQLHRDN